MVLLGKNLRERLFYIYIYVLMSVFIYISFDLWTSPNCYAIMAIVAHYIDSSGARKVSLIALRHLDG